MSCSKNIIKWLTLSDDRESYHWQINRFKMKIVNLLLCDSERFFIDYIFVAFSIMLIFDVFMKFIIEIKLFVTLMTNTFYRDYCELFDEINVRIINFWFWINDVWLINVRIIIYVINRCFLLVMFFLFFVYVKQLWTKQIRILIISNLKKIVFVSLIVWRRLLLIFDQINNWLFLFDERRLWTWLKFVCVYECRLIALLIFCDWILRKKINAIFWLIKIRRRLKIDALLIICSKKIVVVIIILINNESCNIFILIDCLLFDIIKVERMIALMFVIVNFSSYFFAFLQIIYEFFHNDILWKNFKCQF